MKTVSTLLLSLLATASLVAQQPQQPKNVQVLKGLSNTDLIRSMQFMSDSLGVNCDFCHVMPPGGERDFASDAKEEKKTARQMIHLVLDTNAKFFNNRTEVTCQTCHRGSPRPVSGLVLPVSAPLKPEAPAGSSEPKPVMATRAELASRYEKAIGNIDPRKIAGIQLKGSREGAHGTAPIDIVVSRGRTRIATTTPEGEMVNVVTGNTGWMRDAHGIQTMNTSQYENTVDVLDALRLPLPSEIPAEGRVTKDRVNDRDVWVLTSPYRTTGRQRLYFDTETGLIVRRTTSLPLPVGNFPQQTDFEDYRDVGGFKLPFTVRYASADRGAGRTIHYTDIRSMDKVDPSVFEQPK
jgi:photosynthetic reaction center cytochrome c subunit